MALIGPTARAGLVVTSQPDAAYQAATTKLVIPGDEGDTLTTLTDGTLTVSFLDLGLSPTTMTIADVGSTWATWSSPPESEDEFPRVIYTVMASLVLEFSQPLLTFGFELEPDEQTLLTYTAAYESNGVPIGSIVRSVDGNAGARLFAGTTTDPIAEPITRITISGGGSAFAIAQLRYTLAPVQVIPEPGGLALASGAGLASLVGAMARRRRRGA